MLQFGSLEAYSFGICWSIWKERKERVFKHSAPKPKDRLCSFGLANGIS